MPRTQALNLPPFGYYGQQFPRLLRFMYPHQEQVISNKTLPVFFSVLL